ncbi:MAG: hypothetical protein ACEPOV_08110 [Hyphomicrobiales bacterium]
MNKGKKIASWIFQIIASIILLQTLYFKFSGAPESKYIFETLGMEPWGRIGSGVVELFASILLLFIPRLNWLGALIGLGTISGAILFHLTTLGIQVQNDGGLLFTLAIIVFISCLAVLVFKRKQIPLIGNKL